MTKREWKYLRHQYRKRKEYLNYGFKSFTIDNTNFGILGFDENGKCNFGLMIPKESFKPFIKQKKHRTRSEERYFLPLPGYSTISNKKRKTVKQ